MKNINNLLSYPSPQSKIFTSTVGEPLKGLQRYYVIMTAWENGIFEYTVAPKTYQEIATQFGYHEIMTQMFCDALSDIGLLSKKDDKYVNSSLTRVYLNHSSSRYMQNTLKDMKINAQIWSQLPTLLKYGPIVKEKNMFSDGRILRIAEWSEAGSVCSVMDVVTKTLNINRWTRLLDVGGGHGLYSIAFAALNPQLDAFVFDQPIVTPLTREYINAYKAQKVHVISGDFNVDSIGQGYDAIFSSFNQTCNDPKFIPQFVDALNPDGDLIVRRHKDNPKGDAMQTLDWNIIHYKGTKLGRKPHSSDKIMRKDEYVSHLKVAGLEIIDCKPVDKMSEIIFVHKPSTDRSDQ
ncbi:MAG: acetylserotonin O-methyltransferase [Candidatus Bathyarchaeota archaeon]|nr:acetylserotonin O-methyltransferase [Candidatus Bathyarchaeota archaeon]